MAERGAAIVLIGFMGTGKSSVGRLLEQRLGWRRYDTDELISAAAGVSITELFDCEGEAKFRARETEVLRNVGGGEAIVVTGGGIVLRDENVTILRELGTIVNLTADVETLFQRVARRETRPLLRSDDPRRTIAELLRVRQPLYRAAADFEVDTSVLTHDEVAGVILSRVDSFRENAT